MKFKCQQVCLYNTLSGCKVDEYYGICPLSNSVQLKESPKTNADRIRAMSDEELAEFLATWGERSLAWYSEYGETLGYLRQTHGETE